MERRVKCHEQASREYGVNAGLAFWMGAEKRPKANRQSGLKLWSWL